MNINKSLLILGAGQYACVVEEIATALGYDKISFLDDKSERVIGGMDDLESLRDEYSYGIVAIGNPSVRKRLIEKLETCGFCVPTLVHPLAYVSKTASLGKGTVVEALSGVNANAVIGQGCIISMGAQINHNTVIQDYCHIDCGAVIKSNSIVPENTKVCAGEIF